MFCRALFVVCPFLPLYGLSSDFRLLIACSTFDFIPRQLSGVLIEENIAGLTESDESEDEFDDVLYSLIDGEEED